MSEIVPAGLTLQSMSGIGWNCPSGGNTCSRSDALLPGASYAPITVLVNVAANAPSQVTNQVSLLGGGSVWAGASDFAERCLNGFDADGPNHFEHIPGRTEPDC